MKIGNKIYHIAQVCTNGHVVSAMLNSLEDKRGEFCEQCGKSTIVTCPSCNKPIQGWAHNPHVSMLVEFSPPNFCLFCGKSFPWTESKIEALQELIEFEKGLSEEDKGLMKNTIDDIINETPKTKIASMKFKQGFSKLGKESGKIARDILVDIASETAKKVLFPES